MRSMSLNLSQLVRLPCPPVLARKWKTLNLWVVICPHHVILMCNILKLESWENTIVTLDEEDPISTSKFTLSIILSLIVIISPHLEIVFSRYHRCICQKEIACTGCSEWGYCVWGKDDIRQQCWKHTMKRKSKGVIQGNWKSKIKWTIKSYSGEIHKSINQD